MIKETENYDPNIKDNWGCNESDYIASFRKNGYDTLLGYKFDMLRIGWTCYSLQKRKAISKVLAEKEIKP